MPCAAIAVAEIAEDQVPGLVGCASDDTAIVVLPVVVPPLGLDAHGLPRCAIVIGFEDTLIERGDHGLLGFAGGLVTPGP